MNAKTVKRIRQSIGYHPNDKRKYEFDGVGTKGGSIILKGCSRVRYKRLKEQEKAS